MMRSSYFRPFMAFFAAFLLIIPLVGSMPMPISAAVAAAFLYGSSRGIGFPFRILRPTLCLIANPMASITVRLVP